MISDFPRIAQKLYCEPAMITAEAHQILCDTFNAHISGIDPSQAAIDQYMADPPELAIQDGVAIGNVEGVISRKISQLERGCGAVGVEDVIGLVEQAMSDDEIKALVLTFDSPGGSGMGTPEVASYIRQASKRKPIISYADGLMASAAYYMAAGSTAIYASESAMVGSIGTYIAILDQTRAVEMQGVKVELFKAGRLKAAGYPGTELSDEQREYMQGLVDELNDQFTAFVNATRGGIDSETMQGQVFTANRAKTLGLIDSIATFDQVLMDAKTLAARRG